MSIETRVEEFILAPSDPAWGDERNRDEYYRAAAIGHFWGTYAFIIVAILAAAQGAAVASFAAMLGPAAVYVPMARYSRRKGIGLAEGSGGFATRRRLVIAGVTAIPLIVLWLVALVLGCGFVDVEISTVLGSLVGAAFGGVAALVAFFVVRMLERRREARAASDDDVFE